MYGDNAVSVKLMETCCDTESVMVCTRESPHSLVIVYRTMTPLGTLGGYIVRKMEEEERGSRSGAGTPSGTEKTIKEDNN